MQAGPDRFVITQVNRLADASSAIERSEFDVILLDLGLPDSRGLDALRTLQAKANHLPIVVLSGLEDEETAVVAVTEGAQDYLVKGRVAPDLLVRAIRYAMNRKGLEMKLARAAQLVDLAATDGLTGLRNSRHLHEALPAAFSLAARTQLPLSVVMLDIDLFKSYNDAFGHPVGDDVLRRFGAILSRMTRAHDLAARYGGEEFAVLLPATGDRAARAFAERVRSAISGIAWPLRPVTASLGVATSRTGVSDGHALLAQADDALYRAERRVVIASSTMTIHPDRTKPLHYRALTARLTRTSTLPRRTATSRPTTNPRRASGGGLPIWNASVTPKSKVWLGRSSCATMKPPDTAGGWPIRPCDWPGEWASPRTY